MAIVDKKTFLFPNEKNSILLRSNSILQIVYQYKMWLKPLSHKYDLTILTKRALKTVYERRKCKKPAFSPFLTMFSNLPQTNSVVLATSNLLCVNAFNFGVHWLCVRRACLTKVQFSIKSISRLKFCMLKGGSH